MNIALWLLWSLTAAMFFDPQMSFNFINRLILSDALVATGELQLEEDFWTLFGKPMLSKRTLSGFFLEHYPVEREETFEKLWKAFRTMDVVSAEVILLSIVNPAFFQHSTVLFVDALKSMVNVPINSDNLIIFKRLLIPGTKSMFLDLLFENKKLAIQTISVLRQIIGTDEFMLFADLKEKQRLLLSYSLMYSDNEFAIAIRKTSTYTEEYENADFAMELKKTDLIAEAKGKEFPDKVTKIVEVLGEIDSYEELRNAVMGYRSETHGFSGFIAALILKFYQTLTPEQILYSIGIGTGGTLKYIEKRILAGMNLQNPEMILLIYGQQEQDKTAAIKHSVFERLKNESFQTLVAADWVLRHVEKE